MNQNNNLNQNTTNTQGNNQIQNNNMYSQSTYNNSTIQGIQKKSNKGLIIGLSVGGGVLLIVIIMVVIFIMFFKDTYIASLDKNNDNYNVPSVSDKDNTETKYQEGGKRVGNEEYGYVTVPEDWYKFYSVEGSRALQYSYASIYIISLDIIDSSRVSLSTAAYNINYGIKTEGADSSYKSTTLGKYSGYVINAYYPDGTYMDIYLFKAEDDMIHYIAIEGPDKNSEYFSIPESFSLNK